MKEVPTRNNPELTTNSEIDAWLLAINRYTARTFIMLSGNHVFLSGRIGPLIKVDTNGLTG